MGRDDEIQNELIMNEKSREPALIGFPVRLPTHTGFNNELEIVKLKDIGLFLRACFCENRWRRCLLVS